MGCGVTVDEWTPPPELPGREASFRGYRRGRKPALKPANGPLTKIRAIRRLAQLMAFPRIHVKLDRHAQCLERRIELFALRHRAFEIALAYRDQCRRADAARVHDRRGLEIRRGIIVDGSAKIHLIRSRLRRLAFEGQPVRYTRMRDGSAKLMRLRNAPHRHVAPIRAAHDPQPGVIDL